MFHDIADSSEAGLNLRGDPNKMALYMRHNAEVNEYGHVGQARLPVRRRRTHVLHFHHFYSIHPDVQRTGTGMLYFTICYLIARQTDNV